MRTICTLPVDKVRRSSSPPVGVKPEDDHTRHDQCAADDLGNRHSFTEEEVGDHRGEDRFECDDQVGDAGGKETEADVIKSETTDGWSGRENEQHQPANDCISQPEEIRKL